MKKAMEILRQVFAGIGAAAVSVVLFLIGRKSVKKACNDGGSGGVPLGLSGETLTEKKIEEKCNEKRNEALERLANTDAGRLAENYGTVCDAINDGKLRFERRCRELD